MACGLLAATCSTSTAVAADWPACNARDLTPPAAIEREVPAYPESARLAGAEGYVDVAFTILRDGRPGWIRLLKAEPSGFFESATLFGVLDWRFEPARRNGEPVECRIQTRIRYTLTESVPARAAGSGAASASPQAPPRYPDAARIAGLEGYVEVEFEIGSDGRVRAPEVTLAMPRGEFEAAALEAVRGWRFDPGAARRETRRFEFALPDGAPRPPAGTFLAAAPLPAEACSRRIAGRVKLEVATDTQGRITAAKIIESRPAGLFDTAALIIAHASRMVPAWRGGEPIAASALLTLRFEPDAAHCPDADPADPRSPAGRRAPAPRVSGLRPGEAGPRREESLERPCAPAAR